jgi:hypothetical protein
MDLNPHSGNQFTFGDLICLWAARYLLTPAAEFFSLRRFTDRDFALRAIQFASVAVFS